MEEHLLQSDLRSTDVIFYYTTVRFEFVIKVLIQTQKLFKKINVTVTLNLIVCADWLDDVQLVNIFPNVRLRSCAV